MGRLRENQLRAAATARRSIVSGHRVVGRAARRRCRQRVAQLLAAPAGAARAVGASVASAGRVDLDPVAQHGAEEVVGAGRDLHRDALGARRAAAQRRAAGRARPGRRAAPAASSRRRRASRWPGGRRPAAAGAAARCARTGGTGRRRSRAPAPRRPAAPRRPRACRKRRGRAVRVDEAQRQAARGEVATPAATAARCTSARSSSAISRGAGARSAASTTSVCSPCSREGGAQPLEHHAAERDVRVARPPARSARGAWANRRRRPSAWSSGGGSWQRSRVSWCSGMRRGAAQACSAPRAAALPAARRRSGSRRSASSR